MGGFEPRNEDIVQIENKTGRGGGREEEESGRVKFVPRIKNIVHFKKRGVGDLNQELKIFYNLKKRGRGGGREGGFKPTTLSG